MSNVKIAPDVANDQLDAILADLDIRPDPDQREVILRAISAGRLEWDLVDQQFMYELIKPVILDNGKQIDSVTVSEPTAAQMKKSADAKDEFDQMLRLIGYCTDQPSGYIERLKSRDLNVLGALVAFFR
jgi:hypothetical protein